MRRNHSFSGDTLEHATRFIGLAKVGNSLKQKWLYAFSLLPVDEMKASHLYQETTDQTDCPYTGGMLKPILSKKQVNWHKSLEALHHTILVIIINRSWV